MATEVSLFAKVVDRIRAECDMILNLQTGGGGSLAATPKNAVPFAECLPLDSTWSIFGVSASQFPMATMGVLLRGHVRVGFEDNLYMAKGVKAKSNAQLVDRAVKIIGDLNNKVASVEETYEILRLKKL